MADDGTTIASPARLRALTSRAFPLAALPVIAILCKLPTLGTPAYWDEMAWLGQAEWLSNRSLAAAIPGLRPAASFWGHPPGLHLMLAALGKVYGVSVTVAHVLIAGFAALGVCGTYLLARRLYGSATGWLAAFLLLLSPLYFAQSGMFLADVPVAALVVLAMYFALADRYGPYLICASCMVLIKETAIALVVALLLYRFLIISPIGRARLREVVKYCIPLVVIGVFALLQKIVSGKFFIIYDFEFKLFELTAEVVRRQVELITRWIFVDQLRSVFTGLITLNLLVNPQARRRRELERPLHGYVREPIAARRFKNAADPIGADLILVSHPAEGTAGELRKIARSSAWRLIVRRERRSGWTELYAPPRPAPGGAQ